jgi:2-haloacid dehalogenase
MAVERFGVPKEKIGFVSSNFWDAAGAKSFGFTVYWINRAGVAPERLGFQPDRMVKSLAAL